MNLTGFLSIVLAVFVFLTSVVLHECCHGLVAHWLGDQTARDAGRLTLNPLKHIDPFWTVILPGLLFISTHGQFAIGMAKPVPVNFLNLNNPKRDMIFVAAAGPFANLILAIVLTFLFKLTAIPVFLFAAYFNIGLGCFNLVPVPPLDGSRILTGLLPRPLALSFLRLEPFGFLIVLALYFTGAIYWILLPMIDLSCRLLGIPPIRW